MISKNYTRILLILPQDLKTELTIEAKADNRSVNNYIMTLLLNRNK